MRTATTPVVYFSDAPLQMQYRAIEALASNIHEGDWTMTGGEWRWDRAMRQDRIRAYDAAETVLLHEGTLDDATLVGLIAGAYETAMRPLTPRRIEAKAAKARHWLNINPIEHWSNPTVNVRSTSDYVNLPIPADCTE